MIIFPIFCLLLLHSCSTSPVVQVLCAQLGDWFHVLPPISLFHLVPSAFQFDQWLNLFASSINSFLHERLYDFTGASTFVAATLYSLVSSHPDIMPRLNSFAWGSPSNDPFLRNLIVSTAVIAWAVRLKHGSLISLFVVVSEFTQFNIHIAFLRLGSFLFIRILQVQYPPFNSSDLCAFFFPVCE